MRVSRVGWQLFLIAVMALVFWLLSVAWMTYLREYSGVNESDVWEIERGEQELKRIRIYLTY